MLIMIGKCVCRYLLTFIEFCVYRYLEFTNNFFPYSYNSKDYINFINETTRNKSFPRDSEVHTRMVASRYTVHHGIAFGVTFITYAFFHAARKTLSNSKDSISIFWTEGEFNQTCPAPHDNEIWKRQSLASRNASAIVTFFGKFYLCKVIFF